MNFNYLKMIVKGVLPMHLEVAQRRTVDSKKEVIEE